MQKILLLVLLCLSVPALAEKKPPIMEKAKVISQNIGSDRSGAAAAPIGGMVVAVPIYRNWNVVVVETEKYRLEWHEDGNKFITLPVNGEIEFYRDGNWFIVLDSRGKKHKFSVAHMEVKN